MSSEDTAVALIERLRANGMEVLLTPRETVQVRPKDRLTEEMMEWIERHRDGMIAVLKELQDDDADGDAGTMRISIGHVNHFCRVPHILFRQLMAELGHAEFKVLCFLVDQIYGFDAHRGERSDVISYGQIANGITKRDGTVLSLGTGLSKPSISVAMQGLERRGYVTRERRRRKDGRQGITRVHLSLPAEKGPANTPQKPRNTPSEAASNFTLADKEVNPGDEETLTPELRKLTLAG